MELRYMGFDQHGNIRAYKFDGLAKGEAAVRLVVTADLGDFREHHIGIQEGPSLCALKLASGPEAPVAPSVELTNADLRAHADARAQTAARRTALRKSVPRRRHDSAPVDPFFRG